MALVDCLRIILALVITKIVLVLVTTEIGVVFVTAYRRVLVFVLVTVYKRVSGTCDCVQESSGTCDFVQESFSFCDCV